MAFITAIITMGTEAPFEILYIILYNQVFDSCPICPICSEQFESMGYMHALSFANIYVHVHICSEFQFRIAGPGQIEQAPLDLDLYSCIYCLHIVNATCKQYHCIEYH